MPPNSRRHSSRARRHCGLRYMPSRVRKGRRFSLLAVRIVELIATDMLTLYGVVAYWPIGLWYENRHAHDAKCQMPNVVPNVGRQCTASASHRSGFEGCIRYRYNFIPTPPSQAHTATTK